MRRHDLTDTEILDRLIDTVLKDLYNKDFPGRFSFDIPGTNNEAIMIIVPDKLNKEEFCFQIGAHRNGYNMLVSYYWKTADKQAMKNYLKMIQNNEEEKRKIHNALKELSDSVDDKMV